MATVLTYRPKVDLRDDPQKQLGFAYEPVEFTATDNTRLSGVVDSGRASEPLGRRHCRAGYGGDLSWAGVEQVEPAGPAADLSRMDTTC